MLEVKRRQGESISAVIYRFAKKVRQSGILRGVKKRRYHTRPITKTKKRLSALHREKRKKELEDLKKKGKI